MFNTIKLNIALLGLVSMTILGACQINGQGAETLGPGDSGGGATCNDKMIESYQVDITQLEEYKNYVGPILEKLTDSKKDKDGNSNSPFIFSAKMKNWYLINCKLKDVPPERQGLYLETYQTAIHTSGEVFIDSVSYNKMSQEEKAKLLLHELVMGFYLTKYLYLEDFCKFTNSCTKQWIYASKWKMYRPLPYRPLNDVDHQNIRGVTAWLWNQEEALTRNNFSKILKRYDFDMRFNPEGDEEDYKAKEFQVEPEVLVRMFKKQQWSNSFPQFCQFDLSNNISQSTCKTEIDAGIKDFDYNGYIFKQLVVKIRIIRDSDKNVREHEFVIPLPMQNGQLSKISLHENKFGPVIKSVPWMLLGNWPTFSKAPLVEGLKSQSLLFMINFEDRSNPEIYWMAVKSHVWYSFEEVIEEHAGQKLKILYGYLNPLDEDTEILFTEKELYFNFDIGMKGRTLIKSEVVP